MDWGGTRVYEAAGRRHPGGRTPRGDGTCVSAFKSARSPKVTLGGWEQQRGSPDMASLDSLNTRRELVVGDKTYAYYSLRAAEEFVAHRTGRTGTGDLPMGNASARCRLPRDLQ